MADANNPWDSAPAADSAAQSADARGGGVFSPPVAVVQTG